VVVPRPGQRVHADTTPTFDPWWQL
jgi:hypothetical protein